MSAVRRILRELSIWVPLVLLVAAAGALAWATARPDSPRLVAAESWPGVGEWVARFRARYSPPPASPGASRGGTEVVVVPEWVAEPGEESVSTPAAAIEDHAWVAAGEPVRAAPDDGAAQHGRLERYVYLPVYERRGEWARVSSPHGEGWVRPFRGRAGARGADAAAPWDGEPPLGRAAVPPLPLPGRAANAVALAAAVELLGVSGPAGRLGPYPLYTDAPRGTLFALDRVAAGVEPAYRARYGRQPLGTALESVVLFHREDDYRRFQAADRVLAGLPAAGHTSDGLVAAYVGAQSPAEVAATLIHELAHLLNRRALGPALPPWLDEGIADDLAGSEVGEGGELRPGRIGGSVVEHPGRLELRGAVAALRQVDQAFAAGRAVPLSRLTAMDWEAFVRSDDSQLHYAQASFLVRYLLDGGDPALAGGFRRFLAAVAAGGSPDGAALRDELGLTWGELEAGMGAWVGEQVSATQAPPRRAR
jgi:hypothetical protein